MIQMFTDGACKGNPGPGGWAVLLRIGEHEGEAHGGERHTTNNRMEMTAVLRGLETLVEPAMVTITTDSRYVIDGITVWTTKWQKNGWVNSQRKPVVNDDLWKQLIAAAAPHKITWRWIKGHDGHPENERVDRLASRAADNQRK